jgi:hypothetical protein
MPRKKKIEEHSDERLLELLDEAVALRGKAELAVLDASSEIARLASEARRKGVTMAELTKHVKRMDTRDRKLKQVTRQAVDVMLATYEERREPRTTRESRRRRESVAAGTLNADAFS